MVDCIIDGNSTVNSGTHYGGAYRVSAGTSKFSRCIFSNNIGGGSSCRGGAIGARYYSGGSGSFSSNKVITIQIDSCVFENNAPGTRGKDVYAAVGFSGPTNVTMTDCQFLTGGNYNIYSGTATSISTTYFGTAPTLTGSNNTRALSANVLYTPAPTPPDFSGVCGSIVLLSVDLVSFTTSCNKENIDIQWGTISEENNDYFIVEKSLDGFTFEELEIVNGAGNSLELINYSVFDRKLNNQQTYYRLTQVDFDGKRTIFPMITLNESCQEEMIPMVLAANLSNNTVLVHYDLQESKETELRIVDLNGKIVFSESVYLSKNKRVYQSNEFQALQNGMYFIQLIGDAIAPVSSKFLNVN